MSMAGKSYNIRLVPNRLAIVQMKPGAAVPSWAWTDPFSAVVRTASETTIVCNQNVLPDDLEAERDWVALTIEGKFPFSMTGVLSSLIEPLAANEISVFAVSTFDTDYVLVKAECVQEATEILRSRGHVVR